MGLNFISFGAQLINNVVNNWRTCCYWRQVKRDKLFSKPGQFDFQLFKAQVLSFLVTARLDHEVVRYRYALSCGNPTLYASVYACMILGMLGELDELDEKAKNGWVEYFNGFQNPKDGLFYDPMVMNNIYSKSDWWGARHLALHMISAYAYLGARPKYQFSFISDYYNIERFGAFLDSINWLNSTLGASDIDNRLMNIGCILQYQRDQWGDAAASQSVEFLKDYLLRKINPATGLWGGFNPRIPKQRSRMVQFAYHILCLFFYDNKIEFNSEDIVRLVLQTQNQLGGYGIKLNSSACEDIDSIDLLIRFDPYVSTNLRNMIRDSLSMAFGWICLNQMRDGGFVFRLYEPFMYGCSATSSLTNEGAMFPTWFRVLSLSKLARYLDIQNNFINQPAPGCDF